MIERVDTIPPEFFEQIATPSIDLPSVVLFSVYKAGSVLLNSMMMHLSKEIGLSWVDLPGFAFNSGVNINDPEVCKNLGNIFLPSGYCYGGFRSFPKFEIPILGQCKAVLLVRDPRDILVSHYFSMKVSHKTPGEGQDGALVKLFETVRGEAEEPIDDYVLRQAPWAVRWLQNYRPILGLDTVRMYRYEDVIFAKQEWLSDMVSFFGWPVPPEKVEAYARWFDVRPSEEDPSKHVRKVSPGDHKEKLKPETIAKLNEMFKDVFTLYGYSA